jgi:hypothetical protein
MNRLTSALVVLTVFVTASCVDVNGGAVELSWAITKADGTRTSDCADVGIARVRLVGEPVDGSALPSVDDDWPCDAFHGTTAFDIPEGSYSFSIEVVCTDGMLVQTAQVPAPIVRKITLGNVAQLDALLIVTDDTGQACGPMP